MPAPSRDRAPQPRPKVDPGLIIAIAVGCVIGAVIVYRAARTTPPRARAGVAAAILPNSVPIRKRPARTITATGDVRTVTFSPDGKTLFVGDRAGITVWDPETGQQKRTVGNSAGAYSLAPTHQGTALAACIRYDDQVQILPAGDGVAATDAVRLKVKGMQPLSVAFSPDDVHVAAGGADKKLRVWETKGWLPQETGRVYDTTALATGAAAQRPRLIVDAPGGISSVAFAPEGATLAACAGKEILLVDAKTGTIQRTLKDDHQGSAVAVAFSPDGRQVIAGVNEPAGDGGRIVRWNVADGKNTDRSEDLAVTTAGLARDDSVATMVTTIGCTLDGAVIASAHHNGMVLLRDGATLRPQQVLRTGSRPALSLAFSPDKRWLAAGTADGKVTIWDIRSK